MSTQPSAILVERPKGGWRDRARAYRIEVDGVPRGSIRRGGRLVVQVGPGPHTVQAKIDWSGSPILPVEVIDGSPLRVQVEPAGGILDMPFQMFTKDRYLRLSCEP